MFFNNQIDTAMFELTNLCNLRCKMCGIWAEPQKKVMGLEQFEKIISNKDFRNIKTIALTGGEPFLIKDLDNYFKKARKKFPKTHINISTNGFLTQQIVDFSEQMDDRSSITISYDGIDSHDNIRGVGGSSKRLLETAIKLNELRPNIKVSLKLTITPFNYSEILRTAIQVSELGIPFRFKTMEKLNCHQNRYKSEISEPDYSKEMIDSITEQSKEILKMETDINRDYVTKMLRKLGGENVSCNCSKKTLFFGIDGNVFLCRRKDPIGNLNLKGFDEIWSSEEKLSIFKEMKECKQRSEISLTYSNE